MDAILDEFYFKLPDLPVMVCVLQFGAESLTVGTTVSRIRDYDDEVARLLSKRRAMRARESYETRRVENARTTG